MGLLGGHDVDAIAELRQVSVETVRTHIRALYSKIGVTRAKPSSAFSSLFGFEQCALVQIKKTPILTFCSELHFKDTI